MDTTISARRAAQTLHTSVPRVVRCVRELGLQVERAPGGRLALDESDLSALRRHLGVAPDVPGLTRTEAKVLSALSRAPVGLMSARAVARRSQVSPTAASGALEHLLARGLVLEEHRMAAAGSARAARILRANVAAPEWPELAPALARVELPPLPPAPPTRRVPRRLRHLFWNVAPGQLATDEHGPFVARRLLQVGDLEGVAWGAAHLSAGDWDHAVRARGLGAEQRALGANLAAAARRTSADEVEPQRRLEPTRMVGGIAVAGIGDILAMKLKVIVDRGELRDYFDLMAIERDTGRTVEEGLALFLARYGRPAEPFAIAPVVRALGYLGDVDEDELLPVGKAEIEAYWGRRQPEIVRNVGRFG